MSLIWSVSQAQLDVITAQERFLSMFAGRRWGKTLSAKTRLAYQSLQHTGRKSWLITPYYSQCNEVFEDLTSHDGFRQFIKVAKLQPYPRIVLKNNSRIGFRSFERPKTLRGSGLDEVWVDEIQDIGEDQFWPVVRALISDRRGRLIISGQFRGHNWYYNKFFLPGQPGPNKKPNYRSWRFPSSTGIAFRGRAGREELALAKEQTPSAVWQQEYECIPSSNLACVFLPEHIDACTGGTALRKPSRTRRYIMSVDLGRIVDPTVILIMDEQGLVVHVERLPLRTPHSKQAIYIGKLARYWGSTINVVDTTGGATGGHAKPDEHIKYYRTHVPNLKAFFWNAKNKEAIIANLSLHLEQQRVQIPSVHKLLLDELKAYEYQYRGGVYYYSAPQGQHDDSVAALAQAAWGLKSGWLSRGVSLGEVL